jgi:hypothetical protein
MKTPPYSKVRNLFEKITVCWPNIATVENWSSSSSQSFQFWLGNQSTIKEPIALPIFLLRVELRLVQLIEMAWILQPNIVVTHTVAAPKSRTGSDTPWRSCCKTFHCKASLSSILRISQVQSENTIVGYNFGMCKAFVPISVSVGSIFAFIHTANATVACTQNLKW